MLSNIAVACQFLPFRSGETWGKRSGMTSPELGGGVVVGRVDLVIGRRPYDGLRLVHPSETAGASKRGSSIKAPPSFSGGFVHRCGKFSRLPQPVHRRLEGGFPLVLRRKPCILVAWPKPPVAMDPAVSGVSEGICVNLRPPARLSRRSQRSVDDKPRAFTPPTAWGRLPPDGGIGWVGMVAGQPSVPATQGHRGRPGK
jgi:hypothetical protein